MNFISENLALVVLILASLLSGWLVFLQYQVWKFSKKQKQIFAGKKAADLEDVIYEVTKKVQISEKEIEKIKKTLSYHSSITTKSIQKVGLVRFNPFKDTGGDLSFAIALLDLKNDGLVISSLHGREGTRIYSKPVRGGQSQYNLSAEEKQAINLAVENKNNN